MSEINFQNKLSLCNESLDSTILTNTSGASPTSSGGHKSSFSSQSSISSQTSLDLSKQKTKLKKDALEFVDFVKEKQHDPKYKTEMCKSFSESGFCAYGNKCRFAHGRQELSEKVIACKKYKFKECLSFFKNQYCCYGSRCHFRHESKTISEIDRSYFAHSLNNLQTLEEKDIWEMSEANLISLIGSTTNKNTSRLFKKNIPQMNNAQANYLQMQLQRQQANNNNCNNSKRFLNNIEILNNQQKFTLNYTNALPLF